jgi:hypothetical protein
MLTVTTIILHKESRCQCLTVLQKVRCVGPLDALQSQQADLALTQTGMGSAYQALILTQLPLAPVPPVPQSPLLQCRSGATVVNVHLGLRALLAAAQSDDVSHPSILLR